MVKPVSSDKQGTPTYLLVSIVCAIVVFALAEIQSSFTLNDAFSMRYVLMSNVALGLTLAFFWKRLEKSPFLMISATIYLFGLWVSLFVTTLAPILLDGDAPLVKHTILQQFGFSLVALSGLSLMAGLVQNRKMDIGLIFSSLGALGLVLTSGGSFLLKNQQSNEDLITAVTHSGAKEGAIAEKSHASAEAEDEEGGEVIDAHSVAHKVATHGGDIKEIEEGSEEKEKEKEKPSEKKVASHGLGKSEHEEGEHHEPAPVKAGIHADDKEESREKSLVKEKLKPAPRLRTASLDHAFSPPPKAEPKLREKEKEKEKSRGGKDLGKKEQPVRFAYTSGKDSPEHWGELSDGYRACGVGQQQSPIDIPSAWPLLNDVTLDYKLTSVAVVDTGYTIQFNVGDQNYATIAGKRYKLIQFNIHTPSEHWIDGRMSAMEIQFVHKDEKNNSAVISVMVEPGQEQKVFGELWGYVPQGINQPASPRDKLFNIATLLPKKLSVYRYRGSITTPPCSENVVWSVASEKINFSPAQIEAFKARYKNNARPIQKRAASLR